MGKKSKKEYVHMTGYDWFVYEKVYTYLSVREDDMTLYGFKTKEEKNLFLKIISVSGIGPKTAISIYSQIHS